MAFTTTDDSLSTKPYLYGKLTEQPDDTIRILTIEGRLLRIRPNLWNFLDRLRRQGLSIRVWVDAICVNQEDLQERSQQVIFMSKIYAQAVVVLAWLGDVDLTLQLLDQVSIRRLFQLDLTTFRARLQAREDQANIAYAAWDVVANLSSSTYWKRAWIIQEVFLGRDILLFVGDVKSVTLRNSSSSCFKVY